ncbi:NAD(P)-binding domain-containing protein [Paenibacillus piri]|uniref:NAD(P)-binding domain-containing protein n=1 Tax=Paenibacillus piri TaxID=2547395 RepID=UPI0014054A50|nr:NAD(P)-binding domain-containing protein [Paenibacillus piri]
MTDLLIIGAGPYGISLAAHAKAHCLTYTLLGYPMHFWKHQMPQNMFIRTHPDSVYLSDPHESFTLLRFAAESGIDLPVPLPRPLFVDYATWFAARTGVRFTPEHVLQLSRTADGYEAVTEGGGVYTARHAVIATGLQHYSYIPDTYDGLPPGLVSHTFALTDFRPFAGKQVAVIGSGQSAWEAAALLHMAGSDAELIYRRDAANYREGQSGSELIQLGETFFDLPLEQKREKQVQPPGSAAAFLRPYVEGKIRETGNAVVQKAEAVDGGKLRLELSNGETRLFDHLVSASGYRIDIGRVPFLEQRLLELLEREDDGNGRYPKLDAHFMSSLPGLYIAGPLASYSHGPAFRFIAGVRKACRSIIPRIVRSMAHARSGSS